MNRHALARTISTLGPLGLCPKGPGTLASAVTCAVAFFGRCPAGALAALLFGAGLWAVAARGDAHEDPPEVVVDEGCGQLVALVALPRDPVYYLAAFALFRLLDVWKPGPVRWIDRGGSLSVMGDDVVAGLLARVILLAGRSVV